MTVHDENPRIFIEVRGGCVEAVYASAPVDVTLVDHDENDEREIHAEVALNRAIASELVAQVNLQ